MLEAGPSTCQRTSMLMVFEICRRQAHQGSAPDLLGARTWPDPSKPCFPSVHCSQALRQTEPLLGPRKPGLQGKWEGAEGVRRAGRATCKRCEPSQPASEENRHAGARAGLRGLKGTGEMQRPGLCTRLRAQNGKF